MAAQETPNLPPVRLLSADTSADMAADTCSQAEAARLLGVSPRTVRRRVAAGIIPAVNGRPLAAGLADKGGQVSADTTILAADMAADMAADTTPSAAGDQVVAVLANALERAEARAVAAELYAQQLAQGARLMLDGRWRVRRAARRDLRTLLNV
jgi:hypothetical protein